MSTSSRDLEMQTTARSQVAEAGAVLSYRDTIAQPRIVGSRATLSRETLVARITNNIFLLDAPTRELSISIFEQCMGTEGLKNVWRDALMFACVAAACAENNYPLSSTEIVNTAAKHGLTERLVFGHIKAIKRMRKTAIVPADPLVFLQRTMDELELPKEIFAPAKEVINKLKARGFDYGRNPRRTCIVALMISSGLRPDDMLQISRPDRRTLDEHLSDAERRLGAAQARRQNGFLRRC